MIIESPPVKMKIEMRVWLNLETDRDFDGWVEELPSLGWKVINKDPENRRVEVELTNG